MFERTNRRCARTLPVTDDTKKGPIADSRGVATMVGSRASIFKGLLAVVLVFLLVQFLGFKIFVDKTTKTFDTSPWGAVKEFTEICRNLHLPVFVVEPSLLRALRGGEPALQLWDLGKHPVITFGVIEPSSMKLHAMLSAMEDHLHLGLNSPDPRDLANNMQDYRHIPSHYFMWRPHAPHQPPSSPSTSSHAPLIHLVVFYPRGSDRRYLWHGKVRSGERKAVKPPLVNSSILTLGYHEGYIERFTVNTEEVRGVRLTFPEDTVSFVFSLQHSKFLECNYSRAQHFHIRHGRQAVGADPVFRRKARQLLSLVCSVLHDMEVPFWLSSGTCLGWWRQCDIIGYSGDVDIGIRIEDYREDLVTGLENAGLQLIQLFGKVSDSLELSFMYGDVKLDIFFFYEEGGHVWNGGTQASTGKKFKYTFPKFLLSWTEFLGLRVRVPDPPLPYIEANYGKKWEIPAREWDWKKSPANVAENGVWLPEEREQVIQLFEWDDRKDSEKVKEELSVLKEQLAKVKHRDRHH